MSKAWPERENYLPPAPKDIGAWALPLRTTQPQGAIPQLATVPPFWQQKPPGGIDLYGGGGGTLAAVAGATLDIAITPAFKIIPSYKGVLQSLLLGVQAPLTTMDIFFTLLANNSPVPGWDRFVLLAFAANGIAQPFNGPLQLGDTQLTVRATNNAATGPWVVSATLAGWMWPRVLEAQTFGTVGG